MSGVPLIAEGEEETYTGLAEFLCRKGVGVDDAVEQVTRLPKYLASTSLRGVPQSCEEPLVEQVQEELLDSKSSSCYMDGSEVPLGFHVIRIQAKSRFKRLHCVGS